MKQVKTYQIARRYPISRQQSHRKDYSLPLATKHQHSNSQGVENIFRNNQEIRIRNLELDKNKHYNVLGIDQFAIYHRIKQKKRKDVKTQQNHLNSFATCSSQNTDTVKFNKYSFLTRQELLDRQFNSKVFLEANDTIFEQYLINSTINQSRRQAEYSWCSSVQRTAQREDKKVLKKQQFSLAKLKQKMNIYKKQWNCKIKRQVSNENKIVIRKEKRSYKYLDPKMVKKIENNSIELVNLNLSKRVQSWADTLRSGQLSATTRVQQVQTICSQGLNASGINKLTKEKAWVEEKYRQGYFFSSKI